MSNLLRGTDEGSYLGIASDINDGEEEEEEEDEGDEEASVPDDLAGQYMMFHSMMYGIDDVADDV